MNGLTCHVPPITIVHCILFISATNTRLRRAFIESPSASEIFAPLPHTAMPAKDSAKICEGDCVEYDRRRYKRATGIWVDDAGWFHPTPPPPAALRQRSDTGAMYIVLQVPYVTTTEAVLTLVGNIFLPGIATAVLGALLGESSILVLGLLQFLLSFFFGIGWIWAVVWSVLLVYKATKSRQGHHRRAAGRQQRARARRREKIIEEKARKAAGRVKRPAKAALAAGKKKNKVVRR